MLGKVCASVTERKLGETNLLDDRPEDGVFPPDEFCVVNDPEHRGDG